MSQNTLYYGDNLHILRGYVPDETVDLIYLDPPFNSSRNYNVLFKEANGTEAPSQIRAFEDSWTWDQKAVETVDELTQIAPAPLVNLLNAFLPFLGHSPMMAYSVMMAIRLVELRRVLKPTGSIYLHCDSTASHYLKLILDAVFAPRNFRNEIIWKRMTPSGFKGKKDIGASHDVILRYTNSDTFTYNPIHRSYSEEYISTRFSKTDEDGRRFKDEKIGTATSQETIQRLMRQGRIYTTSTGRLRIKHFLEEAKGYPVDDVWTDIPPINSQAAERLGYPTQKPLALVERIIKASSNEGDVVLDPFCGCGTTVDAAQHLGRRWIGIDITHIAISLMRRRLRDRYGEGLKFDVIGEPQDEGSARALADQDRGQFQSWVLDQIDARPTQELKGADRGIDGLIFFCDDGKNIRRAIVQVKSGHVGVSLIRDLVGTLRREKDENETAPIAVFITLAQPTKPMIREAASVGFYQHPLNSQRKFPRVQILTIRDLFDRKKPLLPHSAPLTYKKADVAPHRNTQQELGV